MSDTASTRVAQLDGLRGLAIGLVLLFHYGVAFAGNRILGPIISEGWIGVDLFFVMSGFLIGGIVIAKRDAANFYSVFYLRRILRIFPLYYMLLLVVAVAAAWGWMPRSRIPLGLYAAYLQNIATALTHDYGLAWLQVTWSLAVEEQFYLLLPILVAVMPRKFLGHVLLLGVFIAILCRISGYLIPVEYPRDFARFFTLCRIDDLFYGVLLALAVRNEAVAAIIRKHRTLFTLGMLFLLFGFLAVSAFDSQGGNEMLTCTIGLTLLGPLFLCVVVLAVMHEGSLVSSLAKGRILGWIGRRAYAIYLFHMPVIVSLEAIYRRYQFLHFGAALVLPALMMTFSLAAASWHFLESPLINIGHRRSYGRGAKTVAFNRAEGIEPAVP
jgi:peptidoglycan/LPS O-acetylase OafA/YrhL